MLYLILCPHLKAARCVCVCVYVCVCVLAIYIYIHIHIYAHICINVHKLTHWETEER